MRDYEEMRLADALYWLVHDDDGRSRLRPRILGLALAAGLLGELAQQQKIDFWNGQVLVSNCEPPVESVIQAVYREILYSSEEGERYSLADWMDAFRNASLPAVRTRLCEDNQLRRVSAGPSRGWRQHRVPTYRATDSKTAALPWALLFNRLYRREPLGTAGAFLVGIVRATGLNDHLLAGTPASARTHAETAIAALPSPLGLLVAQTETCVGNDVLTYRP